MPVAVHPAGGVIRFLTDAADDRIYVRRAAPIQLNGLARPGIKQANTTRVEQQERKRNHVPRKSMGIGGIDG